MTAPTATARRPPGHVLLPWVAVGVAAALFPIVVDVPYYVSTGITAMMFVALAVAFDLVVGRIGALSLAQPLFFGFGAYVAGILSSRFGTNFWIEVLVVCSAAAILGVLVGVPSFRLSLHSFAIATLGFAIIGELIARNWVAVTGGPLCVTGIQPIALPLPGLSVQATTLTQQYYVILAIAALTIAGIIALLRRGLSLAFTAVRDDPTLSSARGLWPNQFRIAAFALAAAASGAVGAFAAHFQSVVCPNSMGFAYTSALLIMVFIGGRASLRGVVTGAVLFTVVPQLLRLAEEWRLVIYGAVLLAVVTTTPDGLERVFDRAGHLLRRRPSGDGGGDDVPTAAPTEPAGRR